MVLGSAWCIVGLNQYLGLPGSGLRLPLLVASSAGDMSASAGEEQQDRQQPYVGGGGYMSATIAGLMVDVAMRTLHLLQCFHKLCFPCCKLHTHKRLIMISY
jgi:hypothetical protein